MFLTFNVDYGYIKGSYSSTFPTVTYTDKSRLFSIPVSPILKDVEVFESKKFSNLDELYNYLFSIFGNDILAIYNPPYYGTNAYERNFSTLEKFFPSPFIIAPNLEKVIDDAYNNKLKNTVITPVYNFNSLSRIAWPNSNGGGNIFTLDGKYLGSDPFSSHFFITGYHNKISLKFIALDSYDGSILSENCYCVTIICFNESGTYPELSITKLNNSSKIEAFKILYQDKSADDINDTTKPENPLEPINPSAPGGGGGSFNGDSDIIPDSSLPTISAANTGFTRIYNPSLTQVQELARYLWTDESVISTIWNHIKQFFENPMDAIIGFNLVPVPVPNGGTQNFALMYIDTGVPMTVAANQFIDVSCGTLSINRYYGSALDQSPYTKIHCYLPFIGTVQLNTDEVMGTTLEVKYRVDIVSGSCVAKILVNGSIRYQFSGHCAITIPLSSADFSSYASAAISVAKLVGQAVAGSSGSIVPPSDIDANQQTNQIVTQTTTETQYSRDRYFGNLTPSSVRSTVQTYEAPQDISSTQASFEGITARNISNTVGAVMGAKTQIERSGSFSGNSGYLGVRRPFVVIERPNMCLPANYQSLNGYPAMITMNFGECQGYTRVQQVQLTGITATNPEQSEILQLLKSGVIF